MSTLTRKNIYQERTTPLFIPGRKARRANGFCHRFCLVVRRARSGRAIS